MADEQRNLENPPRYFTQARYKDQITGYFRSINDLYDSDWNDILASAQAMLDNGKPFFLEGIPDALEEAAEKAQSEENLRACI